MRKETAYYYDCRHFKGFIPCIPHKKHGYHCDECPQYDKIEKKILIIKLGAIGDVIRTTPILTKLWELEPKAQIWWLTYSPEVIPARVDRILDFTLENITVLKSIEFDLIINLDKDYHACALASDIKSEDTWGYMLIDGVPQPCNANAQHKFITGLFDDISQSNKKSYLEEMFEICGWEFKGEEYILEVDNRYKWEIQNNSKKIIGLNTGCGARWVSRLWDNKYWIQLIEQLQNEDYFPLLLGGSQEHENNTLLSSETGAAYLGHFPLAQFISLMAQCDLVVSAVTMGMHIAIGLRKPLVLLNNIFNPYEFELYGRGEIIQPDKVCKCYFSPKCNNPEYFCMDSLSPDAVFAAIQRNIRI